MQDLATDFRQVNTLSKTDLAPAVEYFIKHYAVTKVIYGSGFECYPESLFYLNSCLLMLGNTPEVFARQLNKQFFFSTLSALNIPYPIVVFKPPDCVDGWLLKPMQGQGGIGIRACQVSDSANDRYYWQKFQAGKSYSVLFVTNGQEVQVIGFNRQWCIGLNEAQTYVFSGVTNSARLSALHKAEITVWLQQLVLAFQLKGLNSLDFIHDDTCSHILEINPRPSASMALYDEDLLLRHLQACSGVLTPFSDKPFVQTGYQVIYAQGDVLIPEHFDWPYECRDIPKAGNICHTGQPICSIIAQQNESQSVSQQLLTLQQLILNKLQRF